MPRPVSPGAEALLGQEVSVLDHGFVQVIDYMGTDEDIVQAARVSYGPSTKQRTDDRGLLRYLMNHNHTTPWEMVEVKFRMKLPIFVARQMVRTRTANINEMSLRYTEASDEFYLPKLEQITLQSTSNKQGRDVGGLSPELQQKVQAVLRAAEQETYRIYQELAGELGVARELARTVLPVSLYTQWIWKIDLHNLLRFLGLRLDEHAQWETRQYAEAMASFVRAWVPLAWEAFEDYKLHGVSLSRHENLVLQKALRGEVISKNDVWPLSKRELAAFRKKFPALQIPE